MRDLLDSPSADTFTRSTSEPSPSSWRFMWPPLFVNCLYSTCLFLFFFLFETFISCFLHANFTHAQNTWNLQSLTVLILKKTENGLTQCFQRRSRFIFQLVLFYWNVSFFFFFFEETSELKKKRRKEPELITRLTPAYNVLSWSYFSRPSLFVKLL